VIIADPDQRPNGETKTKQMTKPIFFFKNNRKALPLLIIVFLLLISQGFGQTPAAHNLGQYLPKLMGKKIGLVVNQTATIGNTHLVDTLLRLGVQIEAIFAPEHGFRGEAEAGASIQDGRDKQTGIRVISLYGQKKKPFSADLGAIELMVFDLQDVGARFYTYISTLHYVMEACAEHALDLMILDRPNPNGHYVAGPVLDTAFRSFVGMHPIPVVHGMTMAEYARMINGEGWLAGGIQCRLLLARMVDYSHKSMYQLPIPPSPNLPNMHAVYLYPSVCFFEGTQVSLGRGTDKPFQQIGAPWYKKGNTRFKPVAIPGKALNPPHKDQWCQGLDLSNEPISKWQYLGDLELGWLLDFYKASPDKSTFFIPFFDKLAGSDALRKAIIAGKSEQEIRQSWDADLQAFKLVRKKYLIYPDFE
jgi:uncharacterized protein YbbC (DUF1343 family)